MALTYLERFQLLRNNQWNERVQIAVWAAAVEIINEDPQPENYAGRATYAETLLAGQSSSELLRRLSIRLLADETVGSDGMDAADADMQTVVSAIISDLADAAAAQV